MTKRQYAQKLLLAIRYLTMDISIYYDSRLSDDEIEELAFNKTLEDLGISIAEYKRIQRDMEE